MIARRLLAAAALAAAASPAYAQEPPRFTSSVEVTSVDVSVIGDDGRPVLSLTPADFRVRVDGKDRRVVTADWVPLVADPAQAPFVPDGYSSNESLPAGRLFVIAVDQPNIRFGSGLAVEAAASAFIDRLPPADRVAVVGFGMGAPSIPFTSDRRRLKTALSRMTGQKQAIAPAAHRITLGEAQAIQNGDLLMLRQVQDRECVQYYSRLDPTADLPCRSEVEMEAEDFGRSLVTEGRTTIRMVRELLQNLVEVPAPKTVLLISEGFVLEDSAMTIEIGALAAAARTSLYALRLDEPFFETMMGRQVPDIVGDHETRAAGLETLVAGARGRVVNIVGAGDSFFEPLDTELSGYYLLGLESDPRDRDGRSHALRVEVPARRATVRARREYLAAAAVAMTPRRTPREAVIEGLRLPLLMSAVPLRVTSFALKGPERDKVQLLIHADIGTDYASARPLTIGYSIVDREGVVVDSQAADTRLAPVMIGVPSPLQFNMGTSLAPGDYTIKFAVAEGDRVGTIEHTLHAQVAEVDGVGMTQLMVGGPTAAVEQMRPTIGYTANFGSVHGYLETYGPQSASVTVKYEIAAAADGPALLSADANARRAGDERTLFTRVIPVQQLPAGKYVMRAVLTAEGRPLETLSREFEVAPPAVLMTSADGLGAAPVAGGELYLPVADDLLAQPFDAGKALSADVLEPFRARLVSETKAAFEQGIAALAAGDFPKAETAMKQAISPEFDSTAGLSYLAVSFAAAGHDAEAAGAWQNALAEGGDIPQIFDWLGGALMRTHDLTGARSVYEEALERWPGDPRFIKPLSMIYATSGRGREAFLALERYVEGHSADQDALLLGVQWLYHVRAAGGVVHSRGRDLELARKYAAAYSGSQQALVTQWVDFLSK